MGYQIGTKPTKKATKAFKDIGAFFPGDQKLFEYPLFQNKEN